MRFPLAALVPALALAFPISASAASTRAFALTSDFSTGSLSVVNLDTRAVAIDVASVGPDAVARWHDGLLYVVNRFGADNIQVIDPAQGYSTVRQFSVGNGSNPQDIAFVSSTKAYVTRYVSSDLLIVDPSSPSGQPFSTISLAAFADADGKPEMARMIRVDRWLFVACQRLDVNFQPNNPSMIVVVDTQADTVVDVDPQQAGKQAILLAGRNPTTTFAFDRAQSRLLIGNAGFFGVPDGGIEAIDPIGLRSLGIVATSAALGGDASDVVWHTPTHAYATIFSGNTNQLVTWNPTTGAKLATVVSASGGFSLPDMELNDRGELYLCRNTITPQEPPGLLVIDVTNDGLIGQAIGTGLPPVYVTFDQATDIVTEVGSAAAGLALAPVWPNPARGVARLGFTLEREGEVRLEAFDVAGRRIREIARGRYPAGATRIDWRLEDANGVALVAGVYFVRLRVGGAVATRRFSVASD
ncbi:MAG TPA: T9SS type A sorting domain-containing protein [Candidatus Limnocylindria bacterium]|nr:T9SS type A sorting domain-containing protein [Candidatus Limnocylindria bacterium]